MASVLKHKTMKIIITHCTLCMPLHICLSQHITINCEYDQIVKHRQSDGKRKSYL